MGTKDNLMQGFSFSQRVTPELVVVKAASETGAGGFETPEMVRGSGPRGLGQPTTVRYAILGR
jgi:hypothetical protein